MSIESITKGQLSASQKDGGVYSSRLSAFQEKYVRPQFEVDTDAITQEMMRSENFAKAALGSKVNPSNSKMYESHYQLAKDKFDILYSDETLDHYSKDEDSMRKWSELVDQLNQEITVYEQIYEDSYGDPNSADGKGNTYSDYIARSKSYGGDETEWFLNQGISTLNPNSANETMKSIDSKQHNNLKLDLESGSFDYDIAGGIDRNFLEPTDPNMAANLFSYQTEQALFKTDADFVGGIMPTFENDGEEMARRSLANLRQNPQYVNAAVNSYQLSMDENNPDTQKKVTDLVAEYEETGSLDAVLRSFEDNIINAAKRRDAEAKRKEKDEDPVDADTVDNNVNAKIIGLSVNDVETMPEGYTEGDFLKFEFDEQYLDPQRGKVSVIIYDKKKNKYFGWIGNEYELLDPNDVPNAIEGMVNGRSSTTTEVQELAPDENGVGANY